MGIQGVWFVLLWAAALGNWRCFDPVSVLLLIYSKVDARALGVSNGQAHIKAKGGTPPYIYVWSKGGGSDSSRINLLPGQYTVVVSDAIGVADSVSFEIGILNAGATIEWEQIPSGTFSMGSPNNEVERDGNEGPQHGVSISGFKMSKYEVTFAQCDVFCDATGRQKPDGQGWGRGNRPAINVNWNEAMAFALWVGPGCRLPTEAEWEYACRAGTTTPFYSGSCLSNNQANYCGNYPYFSCPIGNYLGQTMPVGSYNPKAWGLCDMHGNGMEWCSDWYGPYSGGSQTNPSGPASGSNRVLRGGSWFGYGRYCRSAYRGSGIPSYRSDFIGFRWVVPN